MIAALWRLARVGRRGIWAPLISVLSLAACATSLAPRTTAAPLRVPDGYALVWSEEFSRDGLVDPSRWTYDTFRNKEGWFNDERQYYSHERADNARVEGGVLVITARKEQLASQPDWGGQRYTSARLISRGKAEWTYGFFEIRARLPCGRGTWPAVWMLGSEGAWPAGGELDIMEHVGSDPTRLFSTVHTSANHGANGIGAPTRVSDACSAFHVYQMHWTPERIRFGIDGAVHFEYVNPRSGADRWPFDRPQFMILNLAIGGYLGGPVDDAIFPVKLEIDYVRVHQRAK